MVNKVTEVLFCPKNKHKENHKIWEAANRILYILQIEDNHCNDSVIKIATCYLITNHQFVLLCNLSNYCLIIVICSSVETLWDEVQPSCWQSQFILTLFLFSATKSPKTETRSVYSRIKRRKAAVLPSRGTLMINQLSITSTSLIVSTLGAIK